MSSTDGRRIDAAARESRASARQVGGEGSGGRWPSVSSLCLSSTRGLSTQVHALSQKPIRSVGDGPTGLILSGLVSHLPTTLTRWPGRGCEPGNRLYPHKASGAAEPQRQRDETRKTRLDGEHDMISEGRSGMLTMYRSQRRTIRSSTAVAASLPSRLPLSTSNSRRPVLWTCSACSQVNGPVVGRRLSRKKGE